MIRDKADLLSREPRICNLLTVVNPQQDFKHSEKAKQKNKEQHNLFLGWLITACHAHASIEKSKREKNPWVKEDNE